MDTPYPLPNSKPLTPDQVKSRFVAAGLPVAQWADANGYPRRFVYMVINGQFKGHRGRAHEVAVKLGLKLAPSQLLAA